MKKILMISILTLLLCIPMIGQASPSSDSLDIKSVNGYDFFGMRFYEAPYEGLPFEQRQYEENFSKETTRYIYSEIHYNNPNYNKVDASFNAVFEYLYPDGSRMCLLRTIITPKKEWYSPFHWNGWGNRQAGKAWREVGTYTVNIYFEDVLVGTSKFTVY